LVPSASQDTALADRKTPRSPIARHRARRSQDTALADRKTPRSPIARQRLATGSLAHLRIGQQTDRLRTAERLRTLLVLLIVDLALIIVVQLRTSS
jgi:hypothetical protein